MQQITFHPLPYTSTQSEDNHPLDLSNFLDLSWPTPFSVPVYGLELSSAQGFLVRYFFWQVFSSHLFCRTVTVFIFKHSSIWTNITVKYCFWTYTESVCVQSGENLGLETYSTLYFVDQNANNVKIIPICLDEMESQIKKRHHSCWSQWVTHKSRWLLVPQPHARWSEITGHFLMPQSNHLVSSCFH